MLLKKHLLNEQGGYDANKLVKTIAFAEYGEKDVEVQISECSCTSRRRSYFNQHRMLNLTKPSAPAEPTVARAAKDLTAKEKMEKYFCRSERKGRVVSHCN